MRIIKLIKEHDEETAKERFKFLVQKHEPSKEDNFEEILAYDEVIRFC